MLRDLCECDYIMAELWRIKQLRMKNVKLTALMLICYCWIFGEVSPISQQKFCYGLFANRVTE